jgi:hypothetical protein
METVMKILALDLGKFNNMCCFFDSETRKHTFLNATTDCNYLTIIFKKHKIDLVVMERLRTIPGVGPRTAEILVACIDDPHRFENGRQVSQYFGLVPKQYQSGETDRNGRMTLCLHFDARHRGGYPLARTILVDQAKARCRHLRRLIVVNTFERRSSDYEASTYGTKKM